MFARMKYLFPLMIAFASVVSIGYAVGPDTPKTVKPLTIDELAANPGAHVGRVSVIGVVGTVNPGKGFVLIDSREFKNCGLTCLTKPGTNKIPFVWSETAPRVKQTVRVDGLLEKTAKGFSIKAEKVITP